MNSNSMNRNQHGGDDLRARFTAWIRLIVWRARMDYFKSQKRHFREIPIEEIDEIPDDTGFEVLEKDEFIFGDTRLASAFQSLSLCQRQEVTLRIAKGFSPAEIAEIMGCDSARISRQYYKAMVQLRCSMTEERDPDDYV